MSLLACWLAGCGVIPLRFKRVSLASPRTLLLLSVSINSLFFFTFYLRVFFFSSLYLDRPRDHDSQGAESRERGADASLLRGHSQRLHAARSLSEEGKKPARLLALSFFACKWPFIIADGFPAIYAISLWARISHYHRARARFFCPFSQLSTRRADGFIMPPPSHACAPLYNMIW